MLFSDHLPFLHFTDPEAFRAESPALSALQNLCFEQHICATGLKVKILAEKSEVAVSGVLFQSCVYNGAACKDVLKYPFACVDVWKLHCVRALVFSCDKPGNYTLLLRLSLSLSVSVNS